MSLLRNLSVTVTVHLEKLTLPVSRVTISEGEKLLYIPLSFSGTLLPGMALSMQLDNQPTWDNLFISFMVKNSFILFMVKI